jgi:hypothetical protein
MTNPINGWNEKLVADHGECDEQVNGDEGVKHDGSMLPLQLGEQSRRKVVYRWRGAVALIHIWNTKR